METEPERAGAAYAALRGRFLDGLGARRAAIVEAADEASRLDALHRLAGAAGSYGFAALGELARRAEAARTPGDMHSALASLTCAIDALTGAAPQGDNTSWKSAAGTPDPTSS
ncbi:Hpt domain-containing protein [Pseudacidovorax sp. RU35E]|uniref:Hpt domain-containing protein n=1 Tax=Pseudacidovorax sp. RU35E TaxID=1907403 RepID=UPI0009540FCB|nr:Hpt domain-containing protein [Pseudacidovorax sp. RU35E]SIQ91148.1 Hpt domain-containing protein [Pseudacidovorax sp. RU35E]